MCIFNTIKDWSLNLHVGKDIIIMYLNNKKSFDAIQNDVNVGRIYVKNVTEKNICVACILLCVQYTYIFIKNSYLCWTILNH